jgi:predicted nucleic acid-binding protein
MIVYLDTSALVKHYVQESGSEEVERVIGEARLVGTAAITRVEMAAALAKAVRMHLLSWDEAAEALSAFEAEWESLVRLQLHELLLARAASLAWERGLRGYDAVHMASALFWRDIVGEPVVLATHDRELWEEAVRSGLKVFPEDRP